MRGSQGGSDHAYAAGGSQGGSGRRRRRPRRDTFNSEEELEALAAGVGEGSDEEAITAQLSSPAKRKRRTKQEMAAARVRRDNRRANVAAISTLSSQFHTYHQVFMLVSNQATPRTPSIGFYHPMRTVCLSPQKPKGTVGGRFAHVNPYGTQRRKEGVFYGDGNFRPPRYYSFIYQRLFGEPNVVRKYSFDKEEEEVTMETGERPLVEEGEFEWRIAERRFYASGRDFGIRIIEVVKGPGSGLLATEYVGTRPDAFIRSQEAQDQRLFQRNE